jgi:serine/threonine protein kinase
MSKFVSNYLFDSRYRLIEKIGKGGFGEVWKAFDEKGRLAVALKIISPENGLSTTLHDLLRSEYNKTFSLTHQYLLVPRHYDVCEGCPYIVMPICERGSLEDSLIRKQHFSERELCLILFQMAKALSYLHENGILHNDVKPANILIADYHTFQLADFGISTQMRNTLTRNTVAKNNLSSDNVMIGRTIAYSAPELFGETPISTSQTDVFALGVSIYEIATHQTPWETAGGIALLQGAEVPNLPKNSYCDRFNRLVRSCMAPNAQDRISLNEIIEHTQFFLQNDHWKPSVGSENIIVPNNVYNNPSQPALPSQNSELSAESINQWQGIFKAKRWQLTVAALVAIGLFAEILYLIIGGFLEYRTKLSANLFDASHNVNKLLHQQDEKVATVYKNMLQNCPNVTQIPHDFDKQSLTELITFLEEKGVVFNEDKSKVIKTTGKFSNSTYSAAESIIEKQVTTLQVIDCSAMPAIKNSQNPSGSITQSSKKDTILDKPLNVTSVAKELVVKK